MPLPQPRRPSFTGQEGNILVIIMVMMMVFMLMASLLIEHFAINEARAVEESLAKVRVYWAMSGMVDYALSRAREESQAEDDKTKRDNLTDYMDEVDDPVVYSDISENYKLTVKGTVSNDDSVNPDDGNSDTGRILLRINLADVGSEPMESLENLPKRLGDLVVDICMRPEPGDLMNPPNADDNETSDCTDTIAGVTGTNGQSWVKNFYRQAP